ncbi:lipoate--protein ligase family protein [Cohnella mopanensis]|uniref:lipoate--protein ligase family protein n=1 Tax=Cohnella mopanensis TaxID=2911966 RepID=UPI001EF83EF7|nr:lipoate--protein ligase family protein [Cohnella mopanensis]
MDNMRLDPRILDRTRETTHRDISYPFALDELLGRQTGAGGPSVCHLWRHPRAFVIGSKDSRLPGAAEAIRWLEAQGYSVLVRHSGGAAVPLDPGVVNLSLILPIRAMADQGFHADFERMYALIRRTLSEYGCMVDKGEVAGSYCPGDYDLQIDGLKFCGIAQRRQVRAMIIQAFVIVKGSGSERAELVREFYNRAGVGAKPDDYPVVRPEVMTSLQERTVTGLGGAEDFADAIVRNLRESQPVISGSDAAHPIHMPEGTAIVGSDAAHLFRMPDDTEIAEMCEQLRQRYPLPRP